MTERHSDLTVTPSIAHNTDMLAMGEQAAVIKDTQKRRYKYTMKKTPGVGISTAYVFSSHHFIADIRPRDLCSINWCIVHPDGTVGKFNYYWDHINKAIHKVCITCLSCTTYRSHVSHTFLAIRIKRGSEEG